MFLVSLALGLVERCQVIEAGGGVGVLRSQLLLPDCQGALVEQLGFITMRELQKVFPPSNLIEDVSED